MMPGLLDDLFCLETGSTAATSCVACGATGATLRCDDCFNSGCFCVACINSKHEVMPFHRRRRWTGLYFVPERFRVEVSLGHAGARCASAPFIPVQMEIAHVTGVFDVDLYPCKCPAAGVGEERILPRQLMRHGLMPGSLDAKNVSWAFTMTLMDDWLAASHYAKVSIMDYWSALWFKTLGTPPERVSIFIFIFLLFVRRRVELS